MLGAPHKHRQAEFVFATDDQSDPEVKHHFSGLLIVVRFVVKVTDSGPRCDFDGAR